MGTQADSPDGSQGLLARTDGSLTPAVTRATLAGRRPRPDLTPYRQPTRQEARGKALGGGLDESGRRDLNPRPPEPHSGALPDCATSRYHRPENPHPVARP